MIGMHSSHDPRLQVHNVEPFLPIVMFTTVSSTMRPTLSYETP
jgi:hypothetical protein